MKEASPVHGLRSTYINHRCRCELCKGGNAEYQRVYMRKRIKLNRKRRRNG